MDELAQEYAGQSVVFIEYDTDHPLGQRIDRWWSAWFAENGSGSVFLPQTMVDSGWLFADGYAGVDFYNNYKNMVEAALQRPPGAELYASFERSGDRLTFSVTVKNLLPESLSSANYATVHAVVYEDIHAGVTNRYARAAVAAPIQDPLQDPLQPGEAAMFTLETPELTGVDWNSLHAVVMVDYRPEAGSPQYDMLQAAPAAEAAAFSVSPERVALWVDPGSPGGPGVALNITGSAGLQWNASETVPWLSVDPVSGVLPAGAQALVSVDPAQLGPGWQSGEILFTAQDGQGQSIQSVPVLVDAYFGAFWKAFLPHIRVP